MGIVEQYKKLKMQLFSELKKSECLSLFDRLSDMINWCPTMVEGAVVQASLTLPVQFAACRSMPATKAGLLRIHSPLSNWCKGSGMRNYGISNP